MASAAAAVAAGTTLVAAAGTAEDGPDNLSVPSGTVVKAVNSGSVTFTASTSAGTVTITCTVSSSSGKTGKTLTFAVSPPKFNDASGAPCTDSAGFKDTFTSSGSWSVTEHDYTNSGKGDEGLPEPNATGDTVTINVPKGGSVDHNSSEAGCIITLAPAAAAHLSGKYNDAGTLTISGAPAPVKASGCPITAKSVTVTVEYHVTPKIYDKG